MAIQIKKKHTQKLFCYLTPNNNQFQGINAFNAKSKIIKLSKDNKYKEPAITTIKKDFLNNTLQSYKDW